MYPYNWISQTNAISKSETMYSSTSTPAITSVTTSLTNAAAWDRTLNWLVESNNSIDMDDIALDSTGWGNFEDSYVTFKGKYLDNNSGIWSAVAEETLEPDGSVYLIGTGTSANTVKNNIYDLAGNCIEWTTEENELAEKVSRGGYYSNEGSKYLAGSRGYHCSADNNNYHISFRTVLYVK